jgi:hypothetical protein
MRDGVIAWRTRGERGVRELVGWRVKDWSGDDLGVAEVGEVFNVG